MIIKSPLTNDSTSLVKKISSKKLIGAYNHFLGINVQKYFMGIQEIAVYSCDKTGYEFYYPFNIPGDETFYKKLEEKFKWYYLSEKWEYSKILKEIDFQNKNVLEIGCGNGGFLEKLTEKAVQKTGIELNGKAVEVCKKKNLNVFHLNISELDFSKKFDIICSFQVMEHIYDVGQFLNHSLKHLKKRGLLIIAVPNNESIIFKQMNDFQFANEMHARNILLNMPPHHMGRWNTQSLAKLADHLNCKLLNLFYEPYFYGKKHYFELSTHLVGEGKSKNNSLLEHLRFQLKKKSLKGHSVIAVYQKL